jgi:pilus assembly protein FimV
MAFGFGFNKQKVLSAAEKCVQQGKLQNAISEYEKIVKADPKDLTVMNTIGDLYSRLGDQNKAADCFKNVGDAYAGQGFTVKAIAMYKKLSKLKPSMECVLRLAELYTQQGLFNDARAQYLQVAEDFLKSGQLDQAVRIFQKTLEMDPDNVPMRTKLAEVYVRLGKKEEAWKLLTAAAESLRAKGQLTAADEILQKMLKLEPGSTYALMLRGRAAVEAGDFKAAIECFSRIADLDTNVEGSRALFQAYLRSKRFKDAATLANKLANVHDDISAVMEYSEALLEAQQYRDVLQVYEQYSDRLLQNDTGKFLECLRSVIRHVQDDPQALESVLAMFQKAGENTHVTEIYELLAHGYVQSGDLEKARDYYLKLMQLEPANQMHARNYQQVIEKLGTSSSSHHLITAEEGSVLIEELEATAPFIDQRYDDETALAVRAALTDAELFISYNMPAKALAPLTDALPKASRDLRLNQKLTALHTRAARFAEAAACCRTLESVYHDAGHAEEASRYGDLASKYEERSAAAFGSQTQPEVAATAAPQAPDAAPEFEIATPVGNAVGSSIDPVPVPEPASAAQPASMPSGLFFHGAPPLTPPAVDANAGAAASASPTAEQPVAEIDLSSEWEQDLTAVPAERPQHSSPEPLPEPVEQVAHAPVVEDAPASSVSLDESIEEVRFYLGQGMIDQAETILVKLEAIAPGAAELAVLRLGIESARQVGASQTEQDVAIEEPAIEQTVVAELETPVSASPQPWPSQRPVLQDIVSELESSLGDGFLPETKSEDATLAETASAAPESVVANAETGFRSGTLDEFVSDLEASLGTDFAPAEPEATTTEAPASAEEIPFRAAAAAATALGGIEQPAASSEPEHQVSAAAKSHEPAAAVDLSDMFGELKHELEEDVASTNEDPETHYNLGVAFREMGLLDEAIGELQKVCQSVDRGHPFPQLMQTYTWLAQCFLDKGVPEVAVRWYEKALKLPNLDQETRTALHYELASSLESAGNNPGALSNFLEVYGNNIDYRDVGQRIKALRT